MFGYLPLGIVRCRPSTARRRPGRDRNATRSARFWPYGDPTTAWSCVWWQGGRAVRSSPPEERWHAIEDTQQCNGGGTVGRATASDARSRRAASSRSPWWGSARSKRLSVLRRSLRPRRSGWWNGAKGHRSTVSSAELDAWTQQWRGSTPSHGASAIGKGGRPQSPLPRS
jgi:hypothetical protein